MYIKYIPSSRQIFRETVPLKYTIYELKWLNCIPERKYCTSGSGVYNICKSKVNHTGTEHNKNTE
jgi:hypothetical protein